MEKKKAYSQLNKDKIKEHMKAKQNQNTRTIKKQRFIGLC
jgi:hypothetical protein